jgi:hypothetical protein
MPPRTLLPEVFAAGSCALLCFGEYVAGSVFFSCAIVAGFVRTSVELQVAKEREARLGRILDMFSSVGQHLRDMVSVVEIAEREARRGGDSFN